MLDRIGLYLLRRLGCPKVSAGDRYFLGGSALVTGTPARRLGLFWDNQR
jgi:hypothetical protein